MNVESSSNHGYVWVPYQAGQHFPEGKYDGGFDTQFQAALSVCRAKHEGGVHPGKIFGGKCNIGWGGEEFTFDQFEVLVARQDAFWHIAAKEKIDLGRGLVAGHEKDGQPLYGCVAKHVTGWSVFQQQHGYHPGKYVAGHCNFGWGGKETSASEFFIWGLGTPLAAPEPADSNPNACSNGETSCTCRGFTGCSKPGYCLCLANDGKGGSQDKNAGSSADGGAAPDARAAARESADADSD